jgi:hypothetical protein
VHPSRQAAVNEMVNIFQTSRSPRGALAAARLGRTGWRPALAGVVVTMTVFAIGQELGLFGRDGLPRPVVSRHVIVSSRLPAPEDKGGETAARFDRLRIPADTTEMQLSFAVDTPRRGARFETEIEPIDGGIVLAFPTSIEPGRSGGIAKVTIPAPPDGDYVLRLHRIADGRTEVMMTKAIRLTRGAEGAVR